MLSLNKTFQHARLSLSCAAVALALGGTAVLMPACAAGPEEPCDGDACESELGDDADIDLGPDEEEALGEADSALCSCTCDGVHDVGVIPETACPSDVEKVTIYMDDEDTTNGNNRSGWIGATLSGSNTKFTFCRVPGNLFKPLDTAEPYAVLKLGSTCPAGSETFSRTFDNEDTSNDNSYTGNIYPSTSTTSPSKTTVAFCLFRGSAGAMSIFPSLGFRYGILSRQGLSKSYGEGWIYTDDEDTSNGNSMSFSWLPFDWAKTNDALQIVSDGPNTTIRMARVQ